MPENGGSSCEIDGVWALAADAARRTPGGQGEGQTGTRALTVARKVLSG